MPGRPISRTASGGFFTLPYVCFSATPRKRATAQVEQITAMSP